MKEMETGEMCSEILSPGLDYCTMNSQQLWFPEQDLPQIKPVKNLSIGREGLGLISEELWTDDECWKKGSHFSLGGIGTQ